MAGLVHVSTWTVVLAVIRSLELVDHLLASILSPILLWPSVQITQCPLSLSPTVQLSRHVSSGFRTAVPTAACIHYSLSAAASIAPVTRRNAPRFRIIFLLKSKIKIYRSGFRLRFLALV